MRKNRAPCCADEAGVQPLIHRRYHIGHMPLTCLKQLHDLPLALTAVANHTAHKLAWIFNCRAVGGVINAVFTVVQLLQARQIVTHVAIGRTNDARRPFHDMVACKQRATLLQRKAQMIAGVPRRCHRLQSPAIARDNLPIGQDPVRAVIRVKGTVSPRPIIAQHQRCTANDWRAGCCFQRRCGRRMVSVGVCA